MHGITIDELVAHEELRTTVVAGHNGLERRIAWAQLSDSLVPWDWLDAGDLLLTSGLIVPRDAMAQVAFVERLAQAGMSGLVLSDDPRCPPVTDAMIEAADRRALPVLRAAGNVPFTRHVRLVAQANASVQTQTLEHVMRIHDEVRRGLEVNCSSAELLRALADVVACELYIADRDGWTTQLPGCPPPEADWRRLLEAELAARRGVMPLVIRLASGDQVAFVVSVPVKRPTLLLAVPTSSSAPKLELLQHAAAAAALQLTRVDATVERERRSSSALLQAAAQGRVDQRRLAAQLDERQLVPPWVIVAVEASAAAVEHLGRVWATDRTPHLLSGMPPVFLALVRAGTKEVETLRALTSSSGGRAGMSESFAEPSALVDGVRQARLALATLPADAGRLAEYGADSEGLLPRTASERAAMVEGVLGPLVDYDREHDAKLLVTLQTYFEHDRSPKRSAAALGVHNQTVNYRINRICRLTGRSMRSVDDVSELWFALGALGGTAADPTGAPPSGTSYLGTGPR